MPRLYTLRLSGRTSSRSNESGPVIVRSDDGPGRQSFQGAPSMSHRTATCRPANPNRPRRSFGEGLLEDEPKPIRVRGGRAPVVSCPVPPADVDRLTAAAAALGFTTEASA